MNKNRTSAVLFAVIIISIFAVSSVCAQNAGPDGLIRDLYKVHDYDFKHNTERIMDGKSRRNLDKYFDKVLASYIWKDLTTHKDEVGVLDFDVFYNAQDAEIKNLAVGPAATIGQKATVIVKFRNYDKRETLTYKFLREGSAWKISNIVYADGSNLLQYFKDDEKDRKGKN